MPDQLDIFGAPPVPALPEGFAYADDLISRDEERALLESVGTLPFREFEFHGYTGKRRVVSFGWRYDFETERLDPRDDVPAWLLPLRARAAAFAGLAPERLAQTLVTEYPAGAAIGWHRDRAVYEDVIGVSLATSCTFRLRRAVADGWERRSLEARPRSVYLLRGPSRTEWEHSIPPVDQLRYSVTFRNLRADLLSP